MKRIRALGEASPGLADYLDHVGSGVPNWTEFKSYRGSSQAYSKLLNDLSERQHGLCGYCENRLSEGDRQIEHVKPRSRFPEIEAAHENMIACCEGGSPSSKAEPIRGDETRFLPPVRYNLSCGSAKGNDWDEGLLDPRELPTTPSLVVALIDGTLEPNEEACAQTGFDPINVKHTIDVLGLNARRLRRARKHRWDTLREFFRDRLQEESQVLQSAELELLPIDSGALQPFFTTARSFFGSLSDQVEDLLAAPPQAWV